MSGKDVRCVVTGRCGHGEDSGGVLTTSFCVLGCKGGFQPYMYFLTGFTTLSWAVVELEVEGDRVLEVAALVGTTHSPKV